MWSASLTHREIPHWFCFNPGDWRRLCTWPSVQAPWQMPRSLDIGLSTVMRVGEVGIKRIPAKSHSLYLLPYSSWHLLQPLLPLQLLSTGSAMSHAFKENLLGSGFFESFLAHGIPEKLCGVWVVVGWQEEVHIENRLLKSCISCHLEILVTLDKGTPSN